MKDATGSGSTGMTSRETAFRLQRMSLKLSDSELSKNGSELTN
jgi:hypothetical protein